MSVVRRKQKYLFEFLIEEIHKIFKLYLDTMQVLQMSLQQELLCHIQNMLFFYITTVYIENLQYKIGQSGTLHIFAMPYIKRLRTVCWIGRYVNVLLLLLLLILLLLLLYQVLSSLAHCNLCK